MSHGDPDPLGRGLLTAANRAIEIQAKLSGNWVDRSEVANVNDTSHRGAAAGEIIDDMLALLASGTHDAPAGPQ